MRYFLSLNTSHFTCDLLISRSAAESIIIYTAISEGFQSKAGNTHCPAFRLKSGLNFGRGICVERKRKLKSYTARLPADRKLKLSHWKLSGKPDENL